VWAWLLGPFVDAWRRAVPEDEPEIWRALAAFSRHLSEAGVGTVSEIFDAEKPFTPRGCIAQAWSVAELLRVWISSPGVV
jgi:glycogen debranching enzyme